MPPYALALQRTVEIPHAAVTVAVGWSLDSTVSIEQAAAARLSLKANQRLASDPTLQGMVEILAHAAVTRL